MKYALLVLRNPAPGNCNDIFDSATVIEFIKNLLPNPDEPTSIKRIVINTGTINHKGYDANYRMWSAHEFDLTPQDMTAFRLKFGYNNNLILTNDYKVVK